jgi:transcriptional regulator with XRE-family HTH domain
MGVRRKILRALGEENQKSGLTQSDIARTIRVHRSVINRELRGKKDITLGRVGELAHAMGRVAVIDFPEIGAPATAELPATATIDAEFDFRKLLLSTETDAGDVQLTAANTNLAPQPRVMAL